MHAGHQQLQTRPHVGQAHVPRVVPHSSASPCPRTARLIARASEPDQERDVTGREQPSSLEQRKVPGPPWELPSSPQLREDPAPQEPWRREQSSSLVPDSLPVLTEGIDWREFRARLVAQEHDQPHTAAGSSDWAHPIPAAEKGCLLLAHPMMFTKSQSYFYQAAILLLNHDEAGSFGVILNRPSAYTLGELGDPEVESKLKEFKDCRLYFGGDVGDSTLQLIHTTGGLERSVEVVKGVYMGGIEAARARVAAGLASPQRFRWFAKYSGWGPGQLQAECRAGVWFTAAVSPSLITHLPQDSDGRDYYHKVLQLMGGSHQQLSNTIKRSEAKERTASEQADDL